LSQLFSGGKPRLTFRGRFRQVDDLAIQPKPVQRPHPPIWFGEQVPKALSLGGAPRRCVLGAGGSTTADFGEAVKVVRRELAEQGKDPAQFSIGKRVYLMIDDDPTKARERVLAGLGRIYGTTSGIDAVPVSGTANGVAAGLREVIDAGATTILLNPVGYDVAEDLEEMERLAAEVIPELH
jgi:alkanesulfonate monooxygenase SsuD/methylene tetrahydromethanopterin reductase-like flavin-dependent oxidoreductase (luciferase family)